MTVAEVRDKLPKVKLDLWNCRLIDCQVLGRKHPFASVVSIDYPSLRWEYSWETIARCVSSSRPLKV
jgi:hypothetical protein